MTVSHEGQLGGRMVQAALNETLVTNPGYSYTWRVHIQPTTWICAAHTSQVNPVDDDTEASLSSQCSRDDLYSYTSKLPSPVILCSFLCHGKTHFILFESWSLPLNVHHLWLYSLFPCARARACVCVCDFKLLCMVNWWLIYEASVLLMSSVSVVVSSRRDSVTEKAGWSIVGCSSLCRLTDFAQRMQLCEGNYYWWWWIEEQCSTLMTQFYTVLCSTLMTVYNTVLNWWQCTTLFYTDDSVQHCSTLSCVLHWWQYTTLFYTDDCVQHCSTLSCVLHW